MKRRTVLGMLAGAGTVGSTILSGCLHRSSGSSYRWKTDVVGELDSVSEGLVFGRTGKFGLGQVFALDAATGELDWTYGEQSDMSNYTELTVSDGVYFGSCGDDDCGSLSALDMDGTERWTGGNSGPEGPCLVDGITYTVNEFGIAQAFDARTGTEEWTSELRLPDQRVDSSTILDFTDVCFVVVDDLIALDLADGSPLWRYTPANQPILDGTAFAGIAYIVTPERVIAVEDAEEVWSQTIQQNQAGAKTEVLGLTWDHLIVLVADASGLNVRLHAFDIATGGREWVSDPFEDPWDDSDPPVDMYGGVIYVGTEHLIALDAASGSERWQADVDAGEVHSVTVREESTAGGHSVVVQAGNSLERFSSDGEQAWSRSIDEQIRDYLVGEDVFVATEEGIYAMEQ